MNMLVDIGLKIRGGGYQQVHTTANVLCALQKTVLGLTNNCPTHIAVPCPNTFSNLIFCFIFSNDSAAAFNSSPPTLVSIQALSRRGCHASTVKSMYQNTLPSLFSSSIQSTTAICCFPPHPYNLYVQALSRRGCHASASKFVPTHPFPPSFHPKSNPQLPSAIAALIPATCVTRR